MKIAKGKGAARTEKKEVSLPVEDRKIGKRKAALKATESSKKRATKEKITKKDPNKPKRPPSSFFVGKAGGEKWKSMSAAEKAPYEAKAAKKKSDYGKLMTAYSKKQETDDGGADEEDDHKHSHRSKSEVDGQDDSDESVGEDEDDEDEDDDDDDD
ncbi:high mobility group B protein 1-like [Populus alba x Populus x berolinensis]|nr:high mobility group B protein 1-like [Populus alba x Populus x berolinensis]